MNLLLKLSKLLGRQRLLWVRFVSITVCAAQRSTAEEPDWPLDQRVAVAAHELCGLFHPVEVVRGTPDHESVVGRSFHVQGGCNRQLDRILTQLAQLVANALGNTLCCAMLAGIRDKDGHWKAPFTLLLST